MHGRVGLFLMKLGDTPAAAPHFQQGYDLAVALVRDEPTNVTFRRRLSNGHSHFAHLFARQGDLAAAWQHQQQALALRQQLVDQSPADRQASIDLMVSQFETGDVLVRRGDLPAAAERYRLSIASADALVAADPRYVYYRLTLASGLNRLARTLVAMGRPEEARALAMRAADLAQHASALDPADARLRFELALAHAALGDVESAAGGASTTARRWYRSAVDLMTALRDAGHLAGGTLNGDEPNRLAEIEARLAATRSE